MNVRYILFWFQDALKGREIKKHYNEIRKCIEGNDVNNNINLTNKKIDALLAHATSSVPFYQTYQNKKLLDFPVVNKSIIKENNDLFFSGKFNERNRVSTTTTGSTGTPFKVYHDFNKKKRNNADTIYFANRAGFTLGEKLIYLRIWNNNNKKSALRVRGENIIPVDVLNFSDEKIDALIKSIENNNVSYNILGYASALELIAKYLDKNGITRVKASVKSIISISESLCDHMKNTLTQAFNTQVVSRYSNMENGIIAQQDANGKNQYRINTASYYAEVLEFDSDHPVRNNETGRIVITDLYSYAMPMIRYDTGDIGSFADGNRDYFEVVEGRKLDSVFSTKGDLLSSFVVFKDMWQYTDIDQYQLIQYGKTDYLFKLNCKDSFTREQQLICEFKESLGEDANFQIEYIKEIPLLSSGKRKTSINTFYK